jgi:hypothetical protein
MSNLNIIRKYGGTSRKSLFLQIIMGLFFSLLIFGTSGTGLSYLHLQKEAYSQVSDQPIDVKTDFSPLQNGFHFKNNFVNEVLLGIKTYGRCGGMSYASLDYYFAGKPVPSYQPSDFPGPLNIPPDGDQLADYIYDRQLDSMSEFALQLASWKLDWDSAEELTNQEISEIRQSIDNETPVPLGLLVDSPIWNVGNNHQVVAYGYRYDPNTGKTDVYIYDNNFPDKEVLLSPSADGSRIEEIVDGVTQDTWHGLFVEDYTREEPPDVGIDAASASAPDAGVDAPTDAGVDTLPPAGVPEDVETTGAEENAPADAGVADGVSEDSPPATDNIETGEATPPPDTYCDPTITSCLPTDILIDANGNIICNPHEEDCSQYLTGG